VWVSTVTGNEEVYARSGGGYREAFFTLSSLSWSWFSLSKPPGITLHSDPAVIKGVGGNEDVYAIDTTGQLWEKYFSPSPPAWSAWTDLGAPT
jgi:hypothetical protein